MDEEEGYTGPATLVVDESEMDVIVTLRGQFEPIDGLYHWYGRINADERVSGLAVNTPVVLRTPEGTALGRLSDPDTWGRFRITGTGRPPFTVATSLADVEGS